MRAMSSMMNTVKACAKVGGEKDWIKYSPKAFSQDWRGVSTLLLFALLCVCMRPEEENWRVCIFDAVCRTRIVYYALRSTRSTWRL